MEYENGERTAAAVTLTNRRHVETRVRRAVRKDSSCGNKELAETKYGEADRNAGRAHLLRGECGGCLLHSAACRVGN